MKNHVKNQPCVFVQDVVENIITRFTGVVGVRHGFFVTIVKLFSIKAI